MDYYKTSKSFITGRYVSEGLRVTIGILTPAFVMYYMDMLTAGTVMSLGALCVSAADNPGPVRDRVNGMFVCNLIIAAVAIAVSYAAMSNILLAIFLTSAGFIFSMLTVYGTRSSSIGIAALLIMVLNLEPPKYGIDIWTNALYILIGGIWFMIFSLLLYKIRPLKIIQQQLGDCVQSVALYLRTRAYFYDEEPDYEKTYQSLLLQQVHIQHEQNLLSELLFKTREVTKESSHTGRVLLMMYLEVAELFESVMTTVQQYPVLHSQFDNTGILTDFRDLIRSFADELDEIGIAIKSGSRSVLNKQVTEQISELRGKFLELRQSTMNSENLESFISLGRIFDNMKDLLERIKTLHYYSSYDRKIKKPDLSKIDEEDHILPHDIRPSLLTDNLNINSLIFRHSIRVAVALLIGFIISLFFKIGHSYWILLTIIVILKPAYSLTKERNKARLTGTLIGIIIGVLILYFIDHKLTLLIIMIFFMAGSYMFLRTNYFVAVLLMTPYILIFFQLLYPTDLRVVFTDRLVDTAIGSTIAFLCSLLLVPVWEKREIKAYMIKMLEDVKAYYDVVARGFTSKKEIDNKQLLVARRNALVSLANLSDSFNRMLSEPKRFQKGIESIHKFVVLTYTLNSHISTLSYYLRSRSNNYRSLNLIPLIQSTEDGFTHAMHALENNSPVTASPKISFDDLKREAESLLELRKQELLRGELETETKKRLIEVKSVIDQFNHICNIASDIGKVVLIK